MISALALLSIPISASAQGIWDITVSGSTVLFVGQSYDLYSLSCFGMRCAACGVHEDWTHHRLWVTFLESTDAGSTWSEVDPGLTTAESLWVIQQIDNNNIVAGGDSGLIMRSKDGGATWSRQTSPTVGRIEDINFCDSLNGIMAVADSIGLYTTSDAGEHWFSTSLKAPFLWQCHCDGPGSYRAYKYGAGPIYKTEDNWKSIDSTPMVFNPSGDTEGNVYALCNFTGGDTIILQGVDKHRWGLLIRSTNGGQSWGTPIHFEGITGPIRCMSSLDRDTVLAGGDLFEQKIIVSSDRGKTWASDSLIFDSAYTASEATGFAFANDGTAIAMFTNPTLGQGIIARLSTSSESVSTTSGDIGRFKIYPNPATNFVKIRIGFSGYPLYLVDILGRKVLSVIIPSSGTLTLDISQLPRGVYMVIVDEPDRTVPVGRVVLTSG